MGFRSWLANRKDAKAQQRVAELKTRLDETRGTKEKCGEEARRLQSEADRLPWWRPFKKMCFREHARNCKDEVTRQSICEEQLEKELDQAKSEAEKRRKILVHHRPDRYLDAELKRLLDPKACREAHVLREQRRLIPKVKGVYAWYFISQQLQIPRRSYLQVDGFDLLYIGIAGDKKRKGNLHDRIGLHLQGDAVGSGSLRPKLGMLLMDLLGIKLERLGKKDYKWSDEPALTDWICQNALVAWIEHDKPWVVEEYAVKTLRHLLPLNYQFNEGDSLAKAIQEKWKRLLGDLREPQE